MSGTLSSSPAIWRSMQSDNINERTTLLRRNSLRVDYEADTGEVPKPMAGGTVLGIHNLAIVFPQFVVGLFLHSLETSLKSSFRSPLSQA